jgi:hypothetical protein
LISITAARCPFSETSICSPRDALALPYSCPVGIECSIMRNVYSPSAGKLWTTEMPPRVPKGAPSTCASCAAIRGTL